MSVRYASQLGQWILWPSPYHWRPRSSLERTRAFDAFHWPSTLHQHRHNNAPSEAFSSTSIIASTTASHRARPSQLTSSSSSAMENSPFNKLSAELRNKIYELALAHDTPLAVCKKHPDPDSTAVQPPLTRVCRQIRDEALGMFYQFNTFVMELISSQIWKWPADDKWGFPLERLKEKEQRCDDTEHAPTWISEILDRRTWEVSEWLKCTSQEHHDVIKKANIVIGTNVFHWEKDFYGKRNNIFDWAPLVEMLRQYGYCGKVGQQKVNAVVRLIIKYTWNDEKRWLTYLCEQLAQEAAKFFEDLGLEVEVTWGELWSHELSNCSHCRAPLQETGWWNQ